jgi:hypothetical protein
MKQKIRKSVRLPQYGTSLRSELVSQIAILPGYQEGISKGFPLFTYEELNDLKEKYKDGLTWENIDRILSAKGIFFKKATFRKYIQEGNISKAIGYRNTEKGRVAIFPADTISHINFIQYYYKVMDGEHVDNIIDFIENREITYLAAIESNIEHRSLDQSILRYLIDLDEGDNGESVTVEAIKKSLKNRPNDQVKFMKMLEEMHDKFNRIAEKDIDKFKSLLEKKTMSILEIMDSGEGSKDEQN